MSTQALEATDRSFLTTDDLPFGFAAIRPATTTAISEQQGRHSDDHVDAAWAILLHGELEEAVDALLLRATFARTPTLTGRNTRVLS